MVENSNMIADAPTDNLSQVEARYVEGPKVHRDLVGVAVAYVNHLEEMKASLEGMLAHSAYLKNTSLEASNVRLKNWSVDLVKAVSNLNDELADAKAQVIEMQSENEKLRAQIEVLNNRHVHVEAEPRKLEHLIVTQGDDFGVDAFLREVRHWKLATFSRETLTDLQAQTIVLIEEALEVGQSVGLTKDDVLARLSQVYSKEPGELWKELGGVAVTWAGVVGAAGHSAKYICKSALQDCWSRQEEIKRKHLTKSAIGRGKAVPGAVEKLMAGGPIASGAYVGGVAERTNYGDPGAAAIKEGRDALDRHNREMQG